MSTTRIPGWPDWLALTMIAAALLAVVVVGCSRAAASDPDCVPHGHPDHDHAEMHSVHCS